jgi:simple sugar transport system substrate-binding protein
VRRRALRAGLARTAGAGRPLSVARNLLVLLLALLALAACGRTTEVRAPDLVVEGQPDLDAAPTTTTRQRGTVRIAAARLVAVTHGQASDPFWTVVKRGLDDAARQTGVAVSYRAPDTYDVRRMSRLIDDAVADRPDGLIVSLPDPRALAPAVRRAERAGIPVVSINSGADAFRRLGVLAHVGQAEYRAGVEGGRRMAAAGVRRALCVDQEVGNQALAQRCRGFAAGLARSGGRSRVLAVRLQDPAEAQRRIAQAVAQDGADGVLTLGPAGAAPALAALRAPALRARVRLATFDLSPEVLAAVRDRRMLFAIDQQPYLQGYLPVVLLAEAARHDLFPARGELVPTGPHVVTRATAARAMELSRRGIR